MRFEKYSGSSNDFILIDNRSGEKALAADAITKLCHRHEGIGADGVIFLESSQTADFRMRIFNSDGSEAEMCGNGIRCLALFIRNLGFSHSSLKIQTTQSIVPVTIEGDSVTVCMPPTKDYIEELAFNVDGRTFKGAHLDTGVPHFVTFVDDLSDDSLLSYAPKIRYCDTFKPRGANVNFAKILQHSPAKIAIRTYERGVEDETQACGTGAVATALIAAQLFELQSPIQVVPRSGEILTIGYNSTDLSVVKPTLTGSAKKIFEGSI